MRQIAARSSTVNRFSRPKGGLTSSVGFGQRNAESVAVSHRTATAGYAGSTGLHVGQSLTFGPVTVGGRLTIPLVDHLQNNVGAASAVQGIEGALTLRLSFGFTVHGARREHGCHGQTPRVRDPHAQHH